MTLAREQKPKNDSTKNNSGKKRKNSQKKETKVTRKKKSLSTNSEDLSNNQQKQEKKNLIDELIKEADNDQTSKSEIEENEVDPAALSRGDKPMNIVDHLDEFRSRLLIVLITILGLTIIGFYFSDILLDAINRPFIDSGYKLNIFNLVEGFTLRLKASFVSGLLIGLPLLVYQL